VTLIVPVRVPAAVGVKVTEIVQFAAAARLAPQVFVSVKSAEAAIDAMFIKALPVFVSVIIWAELVEPTACGANVRRAGVKAATGVSETPVPVSETTCGDPLALSVMVTWPWRLPAAVGVKVTEIAQFAPAASVETHSRWAWKSPDAVIPVMINDASPEFISVTICAVLVEPMFCAANWSATVESVTSGAVPFPVSVIILGDPLASSVIVTLPARLPAIVGVKVTEIAQLELTASVDPQVLLAAKSPEAAMLVILSTACPEFVS
jgi:hypothetical protein